MEVVGSIAAFSKTLETGILNIATLRSVWLWGMKLPFVKSVQWRAWDSGEETPSTKVHARPVGPKPSGGIPRKLGCHSASDAIPWHTLIAKKRPKNRCSAAKRGVRAPGTPWIRHCGKGNYDGPLEKKPKYILLFYN